jgi:DNA (cytosine-5)-methyltransferase 1
MAGGRVLLAVEWDDNAVETYRLNFPGTPVYHGDIANLTVEECLRLIGLRPGELDVLDGSPPCQGFSTSGKRKFGDPRNQLFREYVRLLQGLRPKVFVMENVSGMVKGKMRLVFVEILRELKASGYRVRARLMDAKYYGVPQSRQRVIFIGVREDLGLEPSHPAPQTRPLTVRTALEGADSNDLPAPPIRSTKIDVVKSIPPSENGSYVMGESHYFNVGRLAWGRPSKTLMKTGYMMGVPLILHPEQDRGLSIAEAKRLSSFPDNFKFVGDWADAWARIGDAVPPLFMKAIAEHIEANILSKIKDRLRNGSSV